MTTHKQQTPSRASIVIVDDESNMTRILHRILELEGYEARAFTKPVEALQSILDDPPDLVLTDVKMPDLPGVELLSRVKAAKLICPVLMLTAHGTVENAVDAMKLQAFDYIQKPFQTDDLLVRLDKALQHKELLEENSALAAHISGRSSEFELIGGSDSLKRVREMIDKVAPTDSPVLISGESGTGKEVVARAIFQSGPRRDERFVPINCASIHSQLIESELFGHEKGAFTGADRRKPGLMELASGGTLFLDEIGEMPIELQPKLLRALQEKQIQRVGGLRTLDINIRLIAATNRDLRREIEAGRFREDLFYRINVLHIELEPLRRRRDDIVTMANRFIERICARMKRPPLKISDAAMAALREYDWPGNVRELENIVERMVVFSGADSAAIGLENVPREITGVAHSTPVPETREANPGEANSDDSPQIQVSAAVAYREAVESFDRQYLERRLREYQGNVSKAAESCGISRRNFYDRMEKLNIQPKDFKS